MADPNALPPQSRVTSLDYVRGLAAFGILLYHFQSWAFEHMMAESFWGRVGVYGVAIFYVLSGLTLYHVYEARLQPRFMPLLDFYIKRIFRIFPLLWLIMPVYIYLYPELGNWGRVLLNYTGLFGFVAWDKPIGTGVWSIGNELVFYACFPVFLFAARYSRAVFAAICLFILALAVYFAFYSINSGIPLAPQWRDYVNPLNQIFLFLGGVAIGYLSKYRTFPSLPIIGLLVTGALVFVFYPAEGNPVVLVTDERRFILAACCLAVCFAMYKLPLTLPAVLHVPLQTLGEISYALYLLHPLVYNQLVVPMHLLPWAAILVATLLTIIISLIVYQFYEKAFIRLGQKTSASAAKRLSGKA